MHRTIGILDPGADLSISFIQRHDLEFSSLGLRRESRPARGSDQFENWYQNRLRRHLFVFGGIRLAGAGPRTLRRATHPKGPPPHGLIKFARGISHARAIRNGLSKILGSHSEGLRCACRNIKPCRIDPGHSRGMLICRQDTCRYPK